MACAPSQGRYVQIQGFAQGGTYTVKLNTKGVGEKVETIRDSIDALLLQIDTTLSGYNKRSMLSRFNAGEAVPATPLFLDMYRCAYRYWERSGGLLDCAAGPLFNAWGFGFREQQFPSEEEIRALQDRCGMRLLPAELPVKDGKVDPADVGFPQLNYNAIAQGYSCDVIARYLYSLGVKDMLVDIGEIYCDGVNPSGRPWTLAVDKPIDGNNTPGAQIHGTWQSDGGPWGVVTSGNYRKFYIRDGKKYAHTIDPRSGRPVEHNLLSATIVAPTAMDADAYATKVRSEAEAEANKKIAESLTENLIRFNEVKSWDGKLPVYMAGEGATTVPVLQMGAESGSETPAAAGNE
jgi:thiamine biosynthesis lipoprotein